ncbi:maleylpyruvate isomerase family mycothiol-dependent enzyme [Nocardioides sp.]|uniref:maleylpyruvate isomerase family mycothiol-dependent enzyme n=1 Tax=Nocardioides sp. TaxID=35761 RepID=UPI002B266859|nr:maleylpyruvate isomerase family mycothiol-dependent enzyme [Nocardioides sp.]
MDLWSALADERRAIADRLETLTPEQWATPSLCSAWTVRQMAAHLLVSCDFTVREAAFAMVRARGNVDRLQLVLAQNRARLSTVELVARLREKADVRQAPPVVGVHGPYTDSLVHQLDMWLPLGLDDERPVERWRPALDFLMTKKAAVGFLPSRAPDLWYQATDLEWQHGTGDVVSGTAADLALALLGRTPHLDRLDGPGADTLRTYARG